MSRATAERLPGHGLSPDQVETLRRTLTPFAARIERVALFGSRALGTWRAASDIDLVIHGDLDETDADRLWTLFDESDLPMRVDVVVYGAIEHAGLKAHIDRVSRTLFHRRDLEAVGAHG